MRKYLCDICEKEIEFEKIHYICDGIEVSYKREKKEKGISLLLTMYSNNVKEICPVCYNIVSEKVFTFQKEISYFIDHLISKKGKLI